MVAKSFDPGSVYGYDPDTGIAREMPEPLVCPGCDKPVVDGDELTMVTGKARHKRCVPGYEG